MVPAMFLVLFVLFGIAGLTNQLIFWIEIDPVLARRGFRYDPLSLRRYPQGMRTLWVYKAGCLEQGKSLIWWRTYWYTQVAIVALFAANIVYTVLHG